MAGSIAVFGATVETATGASSAGWKALNDG